LGCSRQPRCAEDYQSRISGPLFDRIDLHIDVPAVSPADLSLPPPAEGSAEVAVRVAAARELQRVRFAGSDLRTNAQADGELLERIASPDRDGRALLDQAAERFRLSARGYHRILRISRTIVDLAHERTVHRIHIAEAIAYRKMAPRRE
jgi:magnesium chelatase family protein